MWGHNNTHALITTADNPSLLTESQRQNLFLFVAEGSQNVHVFVHDLYITAAAVDVLTVLQISQEMTVTKMSETFRVKSHFRHTVSYLKKQGVPANNSIQVRK